MSLAEQLLRKPIEKRTVKIAGHEFIITGKGKAERARLMAQNRGKDGKLHSDAFDSVMLAECVRFADDSFLTASQWDAVDSYITGPLQSEVYNLCGFDKDDIERSPKASDSTES